MRRMCAEVLTTWGVVLEIDGDGGRASPIERASAWFETAREEYFERCPRLAALLRAESAVLMVSAEQVEALPGGDGRSPIRLAASVTEVRPSSFDMALRIRPTTDDDVAPANGRCTVTIVRAATAKPIPIPPEVRDEFIAIQLAARDYC